MKLNLPEYQFNTRINGYNKKEIFDAIRKKYIVLTPEEWVRQNFIRFLIEKKKYPPMLISIEKGIKVNKLQKRFDAVVHDRQGKPVMLIEFKSPEIKINQKVMEQISRYNLNLKVNYLLVSNGLVHYCCIIDSKKGSFEFLPGIPEFNDLSNNSGE